MNQVTTNQLTKKRKKKGFTLIELIAVIAIIGILAAVLVPKVVGYMNDAKESKTLAQARTVLMAFETINAKETSSLPVTTTVSQVIGHSATFSTADYYDLSSIDALSTGANMSALKEATDSGNVSAIKK